jgi:4-hydroxy-2-oxoglutarate aldolase
LITPFDRDGALDDDAHRHNLERLTAQGVEGFVISGSTGQGPYLLPGDRHRLIAIGRKTLGPDPFLICGVQAESVDQAIMQIEEAADGGADTALVMTPTTLIRGNDELVAGFYRRVADAASVPLFLYSVPNTNAYELPVTVVAELAKHPNIVGMKDSGGNLDRIPGLATNSGFPVLAGTSRAVNESVAGGAHGAITASANYAYGLVVDALVDPDAQERLTTLAGVVEGFGLAGTYAASEAVGLVAGSIRLPLLPLEGQDRAAVAALFA